MLLISAKRGARGKAATKMVVKPNCKTETNSARLQRPALQPATADAWFCLRFLPVKGEVFLPTVAKCLLIGGHVIIGFFLPIIVGSLPYNKKHLEPNIVVIWSHMDKTEQI